ncbi:hypothetical protein GGR56DRAFT_492962 [Xylariaceae sp. FL0804]|nr:hypothetical protein GGR56DRAFT_492962 [Xylariaceae sp. FL0804]
MDIDMPDTAAKDTGEDASPAAAQSESHPKQDGGNTKPDAQAATGPGADGKTEANQPPEPLDHDMLTVIDNVANYLTAYKDADGYLIASQFQRIPNRRLLPDYHEIIKEPTAFSTIRTKKLKKHYTAFSEFVRDVALITHNAQVYNRPSSQVFKDAVRLREVFKEELQKLIDDETITAQEAVLPDLGEIPDAEEDSQVEEEEDDEDEDEDEDEEDDEEEEDDDDSDDDGNRRRSRRGARLPGGRKSGAKDEDSLKKRGRPPKVFTPVEARIQAVLKGLRKLKHSADGELLVLPFEKLPDKQANPDYYVTITNPIALDVIKRKYKRKKYQSVDQALADIDLMFGNAKEYNEEASQIHKDAVELQRYAHVLAEQEKAKPDEDFADEDGRLPLSQIQHNGEVWRIGDWVHITNQNDLTKPIVAQIFRAWQDRQGQKWINACWYYRPEQTVHRHEKHFLENEVVKTGQYRDHPIDQVVDRCFVMFVTRYHKGRPRGFPKDKDVYVCESRYNEERHRLNKIKTWASCMPDEVRDKDYEMDLFDVPHRLRKTPSPIKHLLRDDAKPTDPLPKPTWGAPNAPPLIGAVHCRKPEPNESPPPEPTPSTPSVVQLAPVRRPSMMAAAPRPNGHADVPMANAGHFSTIAAPPTPTTGPTGTYQPHFAPRPSPSPSAVPVPQYTTHSFQSGHTTPQMPQTPHFQPHQHQPHHPPPAFNGYTPQYGATPVPMAHQSYHPPAHQQVASPVPAAAAYDASSSSQRLAPSPARHPSSSSIAPVPVAVPSPAVAAATVHHPQHHPQHQQHQQQANAYNPPRPVEVYRLDDATNAAIPEEVRRQLVRDEGGSVLFFTQPALDRPHQGVSRESAGLGHSVRYLADRAREVAGERGDPADNEDEDESAAGTTPKRQQQQQQQLELDAAAKVFAGWVRGLQQETEALRASYDGWSVRDRDIDAAVREK